MEINHICYKCKSRFIILNDKNYYYSIIHYNNTNVAQYFAHCKTCFDKHDFDFLLDYEDSIYNEKYNFYIFKSLCGNIAYLQFQSLNNSYIEKIFKKFKQYVILK